MTAKTAALEPSRGEIAELAAVRDKKVYALDPLRDERWRELVERHPASSVFHTVEWLAALRSVYGYEPVVYTTDGPSERLTSGMVFCKVRSWLTGRRLVSLPFSDHCEPLVESAAEFDRLLATACARVADERWKYCEVRPLRMRPGAQVGSAQKMVESQRYFWHKIDLRPDLEDIFAKLHNSVQRKIRRAEREGLTYEEGNSERLLEHFYKLAIGTRRRQHLPPQPKRWFQALSANFGANLRIRMSVKEGRPVSSILTLAHKKTMTYKYGCSDAEMHPLGGVAMVFWNTMEAAKAAGQEWLDLGRSDLDGAGLVAFKEHLGGTGGELQYWRHPQTPDGRANPARRRLVERAVTASPDWLLSAVGSLCYRHMG